MQNSLFFLWRGGGGGGLFEKKVTLRRIFGEKFVRMGGGVIIPVENSSHGLLGCDTV